jgi:hypothetical protein
MMSSGSTYEIVDGVRRAKAWLLHGATTVLARIALPDGRLGPIIQVAIDSLRSPKDEIDMTTSHQAQRFWNVWNVIKNGQGSRLPPLIITPGGRGKPIADVTWKY